jgi:hypothetical protein
LYLRFVAPNVQTETAVEIAGTDCSSCETLWREYREAMITYLEAIDELEMSQVLGCGQKCAHLERVVRFAEQLCEEARMSATRHEDEHRNLLAA